MRLGRLNCDERTFFVVNVMDRFVWYLITRLMFLFSKSEYSLHYLMSLQLSLSDGNLRESKSEQIDEHLWDSILSLSDVHFQFTLCFHSGATPRQPHRPEAPGLVAIRRNGRIDDTWCNLKGLCSSPDDSDVLWQDLSAAAAPVDGLDGCGARCGRID